MGERAGGSAAAGRLMATKLALRGLAFDAFAIFVEESDACLDPGEECPDEPRFPGRRSGATVTIDEGCEHAAWRRLTDAANSADDSDCPRHRDALTALASRVGRAFAKG